MGEMVREEERIGKMRGEISSRGMGWLSRAKPYLLMVGLQFGMAGNYIFGKDVLNRGMNRFVFIVYRNSMASFFLAPFALFLERRRRPRMTVPVFLQIMALGFLEPVFNQSFTYLGMKYTSASFASAIVNAVPSFTFLLAVIFRIERIKVKEKRSVAKVMGTMVTFGGAVVMATYKGPGFSILHSAAASEHEGGGGGGGSNHGQTSGALYILMGCGALSGFYILQSVMVKRYPAELSLATLICMAGSLQATAVALVAEPHSRSWAIGLDYRLYAPLYTGIVSSGVAYYVQGVVMQLRGPVFATAFNPLCMIIVAALGSLLLREQIHLGSIIGAIIIALGLYSVVWGKAKDLSQSHPDSSSPQKPPNSAATLQDHDDLRLDTTTHDMAQVQLDLQLSKMEAQQPNAKL
ncbi:WAT1-related protein At4g08290-like [Prosopis cineraria]|uniref:WAT1-related protein At4g08290-like n=1 Tax=Prosopis cineraria TaxID=364024 RepID=UPI00240FB8D3|nr:WAT1-related protein At4g08290-like [Prosopis cineraria]